MGEVKPVTRPLALVCILLVLVTAGCGPRKADDPIDAVDGLLRLRAKGVTSAKQYRAYLSTDELASAMASDTAATKGEGSPTPEWKRPTLQVEGTSTAVVRVVWEDRSAYPGWPSITLFGVEKSDGGWRVVDAQASVDATYIPTPSD